MLKFKLKSKPSAPSPGSANTRKQYNKSREGPSIIVGYYYVLAASWDAWLDAAAISTYPSSSSFRLTAKPIPQITDDQVDEILPSLMICLKTWRAASGSATR